MGSSRPATRRPYRDGASAVVITTRRKAVEFGLQPIAQLLSHATVAVAPEMMGLGETRAAQRALTEAGLASSDVDLAELNEAFACVSVLATRETGLDPDTVNVNGGSIALGHPLGSTGTRMLVTLIHELRRSGKEIGLDGSLCRRRPGSRRGHSSRELGGTR